MVVSFGFKGYHDTTFKLIIDDGIDFKKYSYIRFVSKNAHDAIYSFFKEEMQQGQPINAYNLGYSFIESTGYFDLYRKKHSWTKFREEICPKIIYSIDLRNTTVLLYPLRVQQNNEIYRLYYNEILEL